MAGLEPAITVTRGITPRRYPFKTRASHEPLIQSKDLHPQIYRISCTVSVLPFTGFAYRLPAARHFAFMPLFIETI